MFPDNTFRFSPVFLSNGANGAQNTRLKIGLSILSKLT